MIDLNYTKEKMIADIEVTGTGLENCMTDPTDPDFISRDEARLVVKGITPDEILPVLNAAYARRFARISTDLLFRGLTYPLKKGVGNAFKWGNKKNPAKRITVESIVTQRGALVAISDEGEGFDVEEVLKKFRNDGNYFSHGGSGFVHFQKANSMVTYADHGRTLLIRFLATSGHGIPVHEKDSTGLGMAGHEEFMKSFLAANLPYFRKNRMTLDACRIFFPDSTLKEEASVRYVLDCRVGRRPTQVALWGRLLPDLVRQRDYSVASQLYAGVFRKEKKIHIPKPVAEFQQPSLACFKFDPVKDLKEYLGDVENIQETAETIRVAAVGLRNLHQSGIAVDEDRMWEDELKNFSSMGERIIAKLGSRHPRWCAMAKENIHQVQERGSSLYPWPRVPIHGAFSWNSVLYDGKEFFLFHFEQCRLSHPGLDVGGFLNEMFRHYALRKKGDPGVYRVARENFLAEYAAGAAPEWFDDLPFFMACGVLRSLDRLLQRPEKKWMEKVEPLLTQCLSLLKTPS